MQLPADLVRGAVNVVTSPAPNTPTNGIIVPAPGAGRRLRLWIFLAHPDVSAQAVANWWVDILNTAITASFCGLSSAGFESPAPLVFPGGLAMAPNDGLRWRVSSALASLGVTIYVYTTTEAV